MNGKFNERRQESNDIESFLLLLARQLAEGAIDFYYHSWHEKWCDLKAVSRLITGVPKNECPFKLLLMEKFSWLAAGH